ncbi:MAG: alkaline phosphatase D family protein [Verrucomicrobiota bacterium]
MHRLTRRTFLAFGAAGLSVVAASPLNALDALPEDDSARKVGFPQGVASGDPTPDSVVLWTRMIPEDGPDAPVEGVVEMSQDADFDTLIVRQAVTARPENDHTVRVVVTDLDSDQTYYYRFVSGEAVSWPLGRTRTAPAADSERPVRFAAASCQNYEQGRYGAWRMLVEQDQAAPETEQIDFVLFLGDFIYEAIGYGQERQVPDFPSGGLEIDDGARRCAATLEDYRHLYRTYLTDPDLMQARARFPFVCTWDDHEFSNDSWQSQSTYAVGGAPAQSRKLAANQAWFEFIPALLGEAPDFHDRRQEAHDFEPARVEDAPFAHRPLQSEAPEPNNAAAIGSLRIYRAFSWGRTLDLVLTDNRSYRSEHAVPDAFAIAMGTSPRALLPVSLVETLDAGEAANEGAPPESFTAPDGSQLENPRRASPTGTMLGAEQRDWLIDAFTRSSARWRIWGNSLPLTPLRFDFDKAGAEYESTVLGIDSWEGYPSERDMILQALQSNGVQNVVSVAGDHHMHFAGLVLDDNYRGGAVMAEFAVAGISSQPFASTLERYVPEDNPLRGVVAFDRAIDGRENANAYNMSMMYGVRATALTRRTGFEWVGRLAHNREQNRHLRMLDSAANGYLLLTVDSAGVTAHHVTVSLENEAARPLRMITSRVKDWRMHVPELKLIRLEGEALDPVGYYRRHVAE